jgi:hypothetical protein
VEAIIVNSGTEFIDDVRSEMLDWARGLGVDTRIATTTFVLIKDTDGWRAHFSLKRQRDGHDYVQPGSNRVAADYGIYVVEVDAWPAWFPAPEEVPDMASSDLLELLSVAADAASHLRAGWHRRMRDAEAVEA